MEHRITVSRRAFIGAAGVGAAAIGVAGCSGGGIAGPTPSVEVVEVEKVFTVGSYDGAMNFGLDIKVKNNGDSEVTGSYLAYDGEATQGDEKLSDTFISTDEIEGIAGDDEVDAGDEGTVELVWELKNTDDPVTVVLEVYDVNYEDKVEILNETYDLADAETIESEAPFEVAVNSATVTDDGEGTSLLLLDLNYTNLGDEPASFSSAVETKLFQNGVELQSGYLPYNHPASDDTKEQNSYTEVQKDTTVPVLVVYELVDPAAPVELQFIDWNSYDQRVVLETTVELS